MPTNQIIFWPVCYYSYKVSYQFYCPSLFLRQSSALLPRLECSVIISAHSSLNPSGLSDPPTSGSRVAGTPGVHHHTPLIFVFLVEMGFHHVGQAGLELLTPSQPSKVLGLQV